MADIDKVLPNEPRKEFELPGEEQIQEQKDFMAQQGITL